MIVFFQNAPDLKRVESVIKTLITSSTARASRIASKMTAGAKSTLVASIPSIKTQEPMPSASARYRSSGILSTQFR